MRRAWLVLLALCALGLAAFVAVGATRQTRLAFTLGVSPGGVSLVLAPGQTACEGPIIVPAGGSFTTITAPLGTYRQRGPRLDVVVRESPGTRVLSRGTLGDGYPDISKTLPVDRIAVAPAVPAGSRIAVCLTNRGARRVAVYGNADVAAPLATLTRRGRPVGADIALRFEREPRSLLSIFPRVAERAALFRPGWVGSWTLWVLAALVALGVPALLAFALAKASRPDVPDD